MKIGNTCSKDSMTSERNLSMSKLNPHNWSYFSVNIVKQVIYDFGILKVFISKQSFRRVMQRNDFMSLKEKKTNKRNGRKWKLEKEIFE